VIVPPVADIKVEAVGDGIDTLPVIVKFFKLMLIENPHWSW
jgi:hypothetical protein